MFSRFSQVWVCFALAIVLSLGLLQPGAQNSSFHSPQAHLHMDDGGHGHSHFDEEDESETLSRVHGHNATDHAHDVLAMMRPLEALANPRLVSLRDIRSDQALGYRARGLERPPKAIAVS